MSDLVTALSGKSGNVFYDGVALVTDVTGWNLEPSVGTSKYASNNTGGHKVTVDTVEDFTGDFTTKVHKTGYRPFKLRDIVTLQLHADDSGSNYIEVTVVITSHPIPVDINDGEPIEVKYTFEPRGAPTYYGVLSAVLPEGSGS